MSLNQDEVPDTDMLKKLLSRRTKLVVVHHVSNVLGMSLPFPLCVLYTPFRCLFTGLKNLASVRLIYVSARLIYISLFLASVLPVEDIVIWAHDVGAKVLVDACQSVPHMAVDVQNLDADFLVASSHKVRILLYSF